LSVDKKTLPKQKYTNDAAASKKYQGWSKDGIDFFNKVVNDLMQVRNTSTSKVLEKKYMDNMNNVQANKSRKVASVPATQAVDGLQAYLNNFSPIWVTVQWRVLV
jgi:plasmid maintenance system killer protein